MSDDIEDDDIYVKHMGRPKHEPSAITIGVVTALLRAGLTEDYIAQEIQVSPKTLRKHYRGLIDSIKGDVKQAVKDSLVYNATVKRDFKAQQFYLQTQCRDEYSLDKAADTNAQFIVDALEELSKKLPD